MKKLIAVILALVMVLALAACGGSGSSGKAENTVTIGVFEPASGDNGAGGKQETLGVQYANSVQPTVEIGGKTYGSVLLGITGDDATVAEAIAYLTHKENVSAREVQHVS